MTDQPGSGWFPEPQGAPPENAPDPGAGLPVPPPEGRPYIDGGAGYVPQTYGRPPDEAPAPPPQPQGGMVPVEAINAIVEQALERQARQFQGEIDKIRREQEDEREAQRERARAIAGELGFIVQHGGGIGTAIAETWSRADQLLAEAGEHPQQKRKVPA